MIVFEIVFVFFFNDTATTEIYTLSQHDALPILGDNALWALTAEPVPEQGPGALDDVREDARGRGSRTRSPAEVARFVFLDRKSTRLNSSHANISYAVFCLKKKIQSTSTFTMSLH